MASRLCYAFWKVHVGVSSPRHFYHFHESTFPERLQPIRMVDVVGSAGVEKVTHVMPWGFHLFMPVGQDFCYEEDSGRRAQPIIVKCRCSPSGCSVNTCDCLAAKLSCTYFCANNGVSGRSRRRVTDQLKDFWYPSDAPCGTYREILTARAKKARREEAEASTAATAADAENASTADADAGAAAARTVVPREQLLATYFADDPNPFEKGLQVVLEEDEADGDAGGEGKTDQAYGERALLDNLGEEERYFNAEQLTETAEQEDQALREKEKEVSLDSGDDEGCFQRGDLRHVYDLEDSDEENSSDEEIMVGDEETCFTSAGD
jgi:hypothetical protein